jgi:hypothetical protein
MPRSQRVSRLSRIVAALPPAVAPVSSMPASTAPAM